MLVNLFEQQYMQKMDRQIGKMYQRRYSIKNCYKDLAGLDKYFDDRAELSRYKKFLQNGLAEGRHYDYIGIAARDSMWELETLGIGEYGHGYTLILDFSKSLDYAMHRAFGCKMEDIRKVEDYDLISSAIMNRNFSRIGPQITFERLLNVSPEFILAVNKLSQEAQSNNELTIDNQVPWMIFQFFQNTLAAVHRVKYYTLMTLCSDKSICPGTKGAVRSSSYSSVAASISTHFDDKLILHQDDDRIEDYEISVRSYAPYEYIGEVLRNNESGWNIQI